MSNRNGNGIGPLLAGQEFRKVVETAAEQGRRQGQQEVIQSLSQAFPAVFHSELGPDIDGKRAITAKPFDGELLADPVTIGLPGRIHVIGGMTKRLAVAAQLMGPIVIEVIRGDERFLAPGNGETSARKALEYADILIAMERADRETKNPDNAPEEN